MTDTLEPRELHPTTQQLLDCLKTGTGPTIPVMLDFGIETPSHLEPIRDALEHRLVTPEELDEARSSGARITALVDRAQTNYRQIEYTTPLDTIFGRNWKDDPGFIYGKPTVKEEITPRSPGEELEK